MYKIKNYPHLSFQLINNISGWVVFIIASVTYLLTAEPTASLWDCGEFITTSVGLQVGHPPGAPLFMIISRLFAIFAPSPDKQALMINCMSAIASGATILFLFWTISHLARKIVVRDNNEITFAQLIAIMGASLVGALAYTFSDTFWFSAVEGEVYALSSLFTAVVFWAILKWENVASEPHANRWLVLIAYLVGLSIGVHLLNLLAIPAIVFVYYFKKYTPTRNGIIKTTLVSLVILGTINFILIPGLIKVAGWFELIFVNGIGLPFNTGVIIYVLLIIAGLVYGIRYTLKKEMPIWNTILTCFMVILIGYSSYAMVVIRSINNPPIDENSPDNVFALLSYIQRDQYGQSPLIYGQYYNAPQASIKDGEALYYQNKKTGKYDHIGYKTKVEYDQRFCTVFPRMHGDIHGRPYFEALYKQWGGKPNGPVYTVDGKQIQRPSFANNMKFFFNYQMGHMYWRYFMWNFSGRQNDIQGHGGIENGNWITGIRFIDEMRLGNQSELTDIMKAEKGHNAYYMLPFLLGIVGMFYQYRKGKTGKQDFWVVLLLFFLTGLAIILYLNQTPMEPRERDYAYAGSFYAYAIWIGLGVLALWEFLGKKLNSQVSAIIVTVVCLFAVPVNMGAQNWDDHDRSGRYATIAHAKNYLNSCAPNAILFTYGDNDTFPLWYAQEIENVRRDIRIVNLSLLAGDWYIDQMKRKAYETPGVPISFTQEQYHAGVRDQVLVLEQYKSANLKEAMEFVRSELPQTKYKGGYTEAFDYIPTRHVYIPVDSAKVVTNGTVRTGNADKIVKQLEIDIKENVLNKSQLMLLDIIATNNWERPIYFGIGMGSENYMGFEKYFQLEGATYRVVPIITPEPDYYDYGRIDSEILYDNMMNKFEWGNIKDPKVNIDHFHDNTISVIKYRNSFLRLADALYQESEKESDPEKANSKKTKAVAALDKSLEELPTYQIPIDNVLLQYIPLYYTLNQPGKAKMLTKELAKANYQTLKYIYTLEPEFASSPDIQREREISMHVMQMLSNVCMEFEQKELADEIGNMVNGIYSPLHKTIQPK